MSEKRYSDQEIEDAIENLESTDTYSSVINNAHRAGAAHIIRQLQADLKEARNDVELAAGELLLPISPPGTDMARVCIVNRLQRYEIERESARAEKAEAELAALMKAISKTEYERIFAETIR